MKRFLAIFLLISVIALGFSSCERQCICKNLEDGTEGIMGGAYSRKDCSDMEDYYNELYQKELYECTYK
jgi:hypothetical protein